MAAATDWNTEVTSGLVSIGTHSLFVSTYGPPRTFHSHPVVLIFSGTAGTIARWPALVRALSPHVRILSYDRSGLGQSEFAPYPPSMETTISDLHALLKATSMPPPYILLSHSWGGMLSVYFASTFPNLQSAISGLILLDTGAPTQSAPPGTHKDFTTDPGSPWSHPCVATITKNLDVLPLTSPPERCALTPSEYEYLHTQTTSAEHKASAALEFAALQDSYPPFLAQQFFSRSPPSLSGIPIVTVHAHAYQSFHDLCHHGTAIGNGTASERHEFQTLLMTWRENVLENQKQFLTLTELENGQSVMAKEGTSHDVMMMDVEACVEGVRWVLDGMQYTRKRLEAEGM